MAQHGAEYGTGAVFQDFAYTLTLWVIGVVGLFTGSAVIDVLEALIEGTPTTVNPLPRQSIQDASNWSGSVVSAKPTTP
ncbi:hypothetical protein [Gynuella sp.]|uniref:hypothetical protein n=1 Tax=Gynuella sp. TaxID=2969146 RepID=UPI003D0C51D4